jgi:hypothetical protein
LHSTPSTASSETIITFGYSHLRCVINSAHSTPYWSCREENHPYKGPIRHLKSYLEKLEKEENEKLAKTFDNINKWINNPLIDNKISNNF